MHARAPLARHWRDLRWAPPLLAVAITLETAMGGSNSWATRPAAILLNLLVAGTILLTVKPASRVWMRMRMPLLLFVAAMLWATVPRLVPTGLAMLLGVPPDPALDRLLPAMAEAVSRVSLVMAACAAAYRLQTARPLLWWLAAAGGCYAGCMIVTPLPWQFLAGVGQGRYAATIGNWNAAGAYFGMIATLCLAVLLTRSEPTRPRWPWLFALSLMAALVLCMATQSRSAFTLTAMALAIVVAWQPRAASNPGRKRHVAVLVLPLGLAIMVVAYVGSEALFPRYRALSTDSLSRWDIITTYWSYTLDSPLWGWGPGSFFELNQARLTPATALRFWSFGAAHNAPLQIALEAGWPALLLLAAGVAAIGQEVARRTWRMEDIGLIGALAIAAGASLVDIAWNVPAVGALSCVLLGTLWGARSVRQPDAPPAKRSSTGRARGVPVTT
jgi:O-antigen ligase